MTEFDTAKCADKHACKYCLHGKMIGEWCAHAARARVRPALPLRLACALPPTLSPRAPRHMRSKKSKKSDAFICGCGQACKDAKKKIKEEREKHKKHEEEEKKKHEKKF